MTRSPTAEPIMMMRPPLFMCFSAACVANEYAADIDVEYAIQLFKRGLFEFFRNGRAGIVHQHIKSPNVVTVFSTAAATASASVASA